MSVTEMNVDTEVSSNNHSVSDPEKSAGTKSYSKPE